MRLTPGRCWSTCWSSACTPSFPAAPTPSAPCPLTSDTSATSSTMVPSASTAWVRSHSLAPAVDPAYPGLGCAVSYRAYVMPDQWINSTLHCYFTHVAVFNSLVCTTLSCYSRFLEIEQPKLSKTLRITAFSYPFLFDNIPLFYRILLCWGEGCSHNDAVPTHYHHLVFAFLTCFLFASHLPERLAPGCFDYIGHSHQLFHICAIVGTHFQLEAIVLDMSCRHAWLLAHTPLPSLGGTLGVVLVSMVLNCLVIGIFVLLLLWAPRSSPFLQSHVPNRFKQKRE
ncbi:membrane progestin receptor delta-like isoform X2 [Rhincodon typus]|uniref:membrane progestin receptor delta-like isoform X2 n=1 Tax=Rhincodon typus TaxID=259920 RepID=UPI00202E12E2|nr:membrane progestin receptor delta-like isoform X2 [Rhincodon typus]XP_048476378.1 membrane progestin receptor delta-like isoform X2 [Rhincodon typus]